MTFMLDQTAGAVPAPARLFLETRAQLDQARRLRHAVTDYVLGLGWHSDAAYDVTLAVGEALNNAVAYGNAGADGALSICCGVVGGDRLQIEVRNTGGGFQPDLAQLGTLPDDFSVHGRGFALMLTLMDDVRVFSEDGDTVVRLTRRWAA